MKKKHLRGHVKLLTALCLLFEILPLQTEAFAHISVSSSLLDNINVPRSSWHKIREWAIPPASGNVVSASEFQDGVFTAPYSGIYNVFSSITISPENGLSILKIAISNNDNNRETENEVSNENEAENENPRSLDDDDGDVNTHPGLTSTFRNVQGIQTLSVYGTVRVLAGYSVSTLIYSELDTQIIKDNGAIFCVEFIGFFAYIPGFSSHLFETSHFHTNSTWNELPGWRSSGTSALFRSLTGFSEGVGAYSVLWDGIYQISANIKFSVETKGRYYIAFSLDGDMYGNVLFYDSHGKKEEFTLSLSLAFELAKGHEVKVHTKGDGKYNIGEESGFFGVLLNQGGDVPGFSTVFLSPVSGNQNSWVNIEIPIPTSKHGQFEARDGKIIDGRYSHPQRRLFTISALLHVRASSTAGMIFTLQSDESSLSATKTGVGTFTKKNTDPDVASYSICGILAIPADQKISLYIYLTTQEEYTILEGSRVSVATNQQIYQAFHVTLSNSIGITAGSTFVRISNWKAKTENTYSFTTIFPRGTNRRYVATLTGIYYLTANVIFKEASQPIALVISINGDTSKPNSLYSGKGNPSPVVESLSVAGPLFVNKGSFIDVYVSCEFDASFTIDEDSSFSVVFIGPLFAVPGVSTVLKRMINVYESGWRKLQEWKPQSAVGPMFNSGGNFDPHGGNYVIPKDGLYLASAGVKLKKASAQKSTFLLTIAVTGDPSKYDNQNGMQDYIENNGKEPYRSDYYHLSAAGVIRVNKGDNISVYVKSDGDKNYDISQDSRFSVIYLANIGSIYASGGQLMLHETISQRVAVGNIWRKVRSWVSRRARVAPGLFLTGTLQEHFTDEGVMEIKESGIYFIAVHVALNNGDNTFDFAVFTSSGRPALVKKYKENVRKVYTMKLFGMLYLTSGQRISVKLKSENNIAWEHDRAHSGFSIVKIPPYEVPVSIISGGDIEARDRGGNGGTGLHLIDTILDTSISGTIYDWMRIPKFTFHDASQDLSGRKMWYKEGYFVTELEGIYLLTWSIFMRTNYTYVHTIDCKLGINGGTSLVTTNPGQGVAVIFDCHNSCYPPKSTNCHSICTPSQSEVLKLSSGDHVALYIHFRNVLVNPIYITELAPYFSVRYLQAMQPFPEGFHMQLMEHLTAINSGDTVLRGWDTVIEDKQFYHHLGRGHDEYVVSEPGIYLTNVHIEMRSIIGLVEIAVRSIPNKNIHRSLHYSEDTREFTMSLTGLMSLDPNDKFSIIITSEDDNFVIRKRTTKSLVLIGRQNDVIGFSATYRKQITKTFGWKWSKLDGWVTWVSGKNSFFEYDFGFQSKESYIVQEAGYYLVLLNLVCKNAEMSPVVVEMTVKVNKVIDNTRGMTDKKLMRAGTNGYATLQVHGSMYLTRWDLVQPQFRVESDEHTVTFQDKSSFSIVKIGENISSVPMNRMDGGPRLISADLPEHIRIQKTKEMEWACLAIGVQTNYQWMKNLQPINGATLKNYNAKHLKVNDSGEYVCKVSSKGVAVYSNIAHVTVYDPLPKFLNPVSEYTMETQENGEEKVDLLLLKLIAGSLTTPTANMTFTIVEGDPDEQFQLTPANSTSSTTLSRVKQLDREHVNTVVLTIEANNLLNPIMSAYQNVTIIVTDLNDNAPVFLNNYVIVTISEDIVAGSHVVSVNATDRDSDANAEIRYSIVPGSAKTVFLIDPVSGEITVNKSLDRETRDKYFLFVEANDKMFSTYAEVSITVADVNEHKPYFLNRLYNVTVAETHSPGDVIVTVLASDKDSGENAKIFYNVTSGNDARVFYINDRGEIFNSKRLDYEGNKTYDLVVTIRDEGKPPLHGDGVAMVKIMIADRNDHSPWFSKSVHVGYVVENSTSFYPLFQVNATDYDDGDNAKVTYTIPEYDNNSSIFEINNVSGIIGLKHVLNFEDKQTYQFIVQATDAGTPPRTSTTTALVQVLDDNDNAPVFTNQSAFIRVAESPTSSRKIYLAAASDADSGTNSEVSYEIVSGNEKGIFGIDSNTGVMYTKLPLDREEDDYYELKLSATDHGYPPLTSEDLFLLMIQVDDINDNFPIFNGSRERKHYAYTADENLDIGSIIGRLVVKDNDVGENKMLNVSVQYRQNPDLFVVRHHQGDVYHLALGESLDFEDRDKHMFYVVAKDHGEPSLESKITVAVTVRNTNDHAPQFPRAPPEINLNIDNIYTNMTVYKFYATDADGAGCDLCVTKLSFLIERGNKDGAFLLEVDSGIVRLADMTMLIKQQIHILTIRVEDDGIPPLSSTTELQVQLIIKPTINLKKTKINSYDFWAVVSLEGYLNMNALERIEVVVQQYHPENPTFNIESKNKPVSWHNIFPSGRKGEYYMRRYTAVEYRVSFSSPIAKYERNVTIGSDTSCTDEKHIDTKICNGPVASGQSYRLQLRLYEKGSVVPVDSHFSIPLRIEKIDFHTARLVEVTDHGIMILAAAFCAVYLITVLVILLYVGWKKKHEILYIDHLRERRMIPMDEKQKFMPLNESTTYFSPDTRKMQRYEGGIRNPGYQENPYASSEPELYNPSGLDDEMATPKWMTSEQNEELSLYTSDDITPSQGTAKSANSKRRPTVMDYFNEKAQYASNEENGDENGDEKEMKEEVEIVSV